MNQTERRSRSYRLRFDDHSDELIEATSAVEAVARRAGGAQSRLPFQVTDLTAIAEWKESMLHREAVSAPMPLRTRLYGRFEDEMPAPRRHLAKEMA